ncbi:centromere binding protein B, DNA binding protein [Ancylostoma ceylanicum]|uniref:Centromere binding protein B, DNA binding protein n=1 Tax=Ancylostoma ceylanicum TaxID=53326 RepID=A0A0D6LXA7_9BILA|nr:centromere binding protein B, DNA binding protein [Ancylostoma ceylanicum]
MYLLDFRSLEHASAQLISVYEALYNTNASQSPEQPLLSTASPPDCPTTSANVIRPTPLRPPLLPTKGDDPLDLSAQNRQSVIHDGSQSQASSDDSQPLLPTCTEGNMNAEWIALKLAASAGSNRMSYPREFKLMVIDYYHSNGQNKYRTCKEFQITKSMLNGWLSKIEKIRESRPGSLKSGRSGRRPQFPAIEKQLFSLYCQRLETGNKVGNRWLRERARELAGDSNAACQFSERWLSNFKKRFHINVQRENDSAADSQSVHSTSSEKQTCSDTEMESLSEHIEAENGIRKDVVAEIVNQPGQLPIQAFYERFPWLCKKGTQVEPGRRGRKVQFPDVERVLYERLLEKQRSGERISNRWLQDQARDLATELCPAILEEAIKSSRCLFSEHWLHNFKKRYGVSLKYKSATIERGQESASTSAQVSPVPSTDTMDANLTVLQLHSWFMNQCYAPPLWSPANSQAYTFS